MTHLNNLFFFWKWWVSPYINHFVSADTIVPGYTNSQNLNRYSYVTNNPLRYTDPNGHMRVADGPVQDRFRKSVYHRYRSPRPQRGEREGKSNVDTPEYSNSGTSIQASNSLSIGEPQNMGNYLSGIWMGGGQPNNYYVGGMHVEDEGDMYYVTSTAAGLHYGATYGVEFYEHGSIINVSENYSLSQNTFYTEVESAGSVLNIKTSDGVAHRLALGELEVGDSKKRTTSINVYGSYPAQMNISLFINLSETLVTSAPLPNFEFFNQPSSVYP